MSSMIMNLDFISKKPELLFWKNERLQTIYGGVLSLLVILIGGSAASYFIFAFASSTRPLVNASQYQSNETLLYNRSNLFLMFTIVDGQGKPFVNPETIFTPHVLQMIFKYVQNPNNPNEKILTKPHIRINNTLKCNTEYLNSYYKTIHENIQSYSDYYCLDPNFNFSLQNAFANIGDNAYLNIYI